VCISSRPTAVNQYYRTQESKDNFAIENIVTTQDELYKAAAETETASGAAKEILSYREALYVGLNKMYSQKNCCL
jgi:hypothetical protein